MRIILPTLLALSIAIGGGAFSAWYALEHASAFTSVRLGAWVWRQDYGLPRADPYSRALLARSATLPIGRAEGWTVAAGSDDAGDPLRRNCAYRIEGTVPVSRFWTLVAVDGGGRPLDSGLLAPRLNSLQVLRRADNSFSISVGHLPAPGNWLTTDGQGAMGLVLTLYDTPVAAGSDRSGLSLPRIEKLGCDG